MTLTDEQIEEIKALAEAATPGPWYHCQPFKTVPAQRTIHGSVPAQRVDYVSTWSDVGTPNGHRIIAHMDGREVGMRSNDMAFIAAANPATVLTILSALTAAEERADKAENLQKMVDKVKAEGIGFWKPCTGCHESEMGQTILGGWSKMFGCEQGIGCIECGGLGVIWDSDDYEDMAEWIREDDKKESDRESELTALRARVAELEMALRIARRLCENINEFGAVTDEEIHDAADNAIGAALEGASHG